MTARTLEPFDPAAVEAWTLGDGRRGVLLLHGFAGTPPELRGLGERLAAEGWRCAAPALAGHATTPAALAHTGWRDWAQSAQEALDELFAECDEVMVAGQSMGGTLALHLAAVDSRITAVAALAAPIFIRSRVRRLLPVLKQVVRWHQPGGEVDLFRREGIDELHSYGRRSTHAIHELFLLLDHTADELAMIRQPVLLLHGGRDTVVQPRNVAMIRSRLVCSAHVETEILPRSGHAISVDIDRDTVNARVAEWFERYSSVPPAGQTTSGSVSASLSSAR